MAEAAAMLIEAWDEAQRRIACRPFPDDAERRLWYYTPTDHGGLPLAAMTPKPRLWALVSPLATLGSADDGTSVLTLISDDNFSGWQRTVLLQFGISPAPPRTGG